MGAVGQADISRLADALRQTAQDSQITTQQVLVQSANQILAEMESRVPVDTGRLRTSLRIQVDPNRVTIGPDENIAPYGGYVEFGTKPHDIRPKTPGGVLVFKMNGRTVYTKKVRHPGTKAQPFVRPAFEAWVDSLGTMAAEANIKVLKDGAR
jgi:HK97 gp10 family phage protein